MTLDDLERWNKAFLSFYRFFGDFGLRDTFQERIAPKLIKIDIEKLRIKFSPLNVYFDGPSVNFLSSRKLAHEGIKERYLPKSRYFSDVCQFLVKTVADKHGYAIGFLRVSCSNFLFCTLCPKSIPST